MIVACAFLFTAQTPWLRVDDQTNTWILRLLAQARTPWLTDALAGVLLGASCALLAAFAVGELQGRWTAHRTARSAHPPIPGTVRPADRR